MKDPMSNGVVYFCGGLKPIMELCISIYSLRKHYSGNITVLLGETSLKYAQSLLDQTGVNVVIIPNSSQDLKVNQHWSTRWRAMNFVDYDKIIHLDCDTIIVKPIDKLFDDIHKDKDCMTSFDSFNDGSKYWKWDEHLKMYKEKDDYFNNNIVKPLYIEFGLMGWNKGYPYFNEISQACDIMKDDQTAMSSVLIKNGRKGFCPKHQYKLIKRTTNYYGLRYDDHFATVVWHLTTSRAKCPGFALWWREFIDAYLNDYMKFKSNKNLIKSLQPYVFKQLINKTYPSSISKEGSIYIVKDSDINHLIR